MESENANKQPGLPPYLFNAWRFGQHHGLIAKENNELDGWTVSSLVETCLKFQLNAHKTLHETRASKTLTPSSFFSMIAGKILDELNKSDKPEADARAVADSLNTATLQHLLRDPRSTYRVLRAFHSLQQTVEKSSTQNLRRAIDIDEAILQNERYIRSRTEVENEDGKYLVGLSELYTAVRAGPDGPFRVAFTRMEPPKGGLELLDERRPREVCMPLNDRYFTEAFGNATGGLLRGLDWANVLAAGGKVLGTLIMAKGVEESSDVDLYIYGLNAEQANQKVRHIYQVWSDNLPGYTPEKLIVKNPKTINFMATYPHCRIQIVLKLVSSPTEALLNFDLDVCAIGFDGSRVFMLPRCARAIETGYSVFTMDLIWGHYLSDRRETQESRVFKYADRGFGLRILPSYAKSLEEDDLERQCCKDDKMAVDGEYDKDVGSWVGRDRKPHGSKEPGLKTLKRVAYLGQDYVRRFYFGITPLAIFPNCPYPEEWTGELVEDRFIEDWGDDSDFSSEDSDNEVRWGAHAPQYNEDVWKKTYSLTEKRNERRRLAAETGNRQKCPVIQLAKLDTRDMRQGLPDSHRGLGSFELFMRHCEAWRLDAIGYAIFDRQDASSFAYDFGNYDDLPSYQWNSELQLYKFAESMDTYNDELFHSLKEAIRARLPGFDRHSSMSGFRDYLTRRIRRQVYGYDLESVFEKQLTIPLIIPWDLENYINTQLPQDFPELVPYMAEDQLLIPVHDPSKYNPATAILPSLQDIASEKGNVRYWVINNTNMWAGQHRALDEIAEVFWSLFHWFNRAVSMFGHQITTSTRPWRTFAGRRDLNNLGTGIKECLWHIARYYRRRIILPQIPSDDSNSDGHGYDHRTSSSPAHSIKTAVPTLRESLLFRPWVFHTPKRPEWHPTHPFPYRHATHPLFDDDTILYPFPDELFWKEGDEGEWDEDGAPAWRVVGKQDQKRRGEVMFY